MKTRFAPSPTGYLHLGHAYSALVTYRAAMDAGGQCLLRIEDIDQTRCKLEYERAILDDLKWLGVEWTGPVLRQSDRLEAYGSRLNSLIERGLVYRCFRSRKEIAELEGAPHGAPDSPFRGGPLAEREEKARLADGLPFSWRLSLDAAESLFPLGKLTWTEVVDGQPISHAADYSVFGDIILGRKDSGTSYHIASIHDDDDTGVTHVVRGADLRSAAGLHRLLYALFDLPPPIYQHHRLILGADGKRLAKRDQATTLASLRDAGATPADIARQVGL